jgi:hypothetical protein
MIARHSVQQGRAGRVVHHCRKRAVRGLPRRRHRLRVGRRGRAARGGRRVFVPGASSASRGPVDVKKTKALAIIKHTASHDAAVASAAGAAPAAGRRRRRRPAPFVGAARRRGHAGPDPGAGQGRAAGALPLRRATVGGPARRAARAAPRGGRDDRRRRPPARVLPERAGRELVPARGGGPVRQAQLPRLPRARRALLAGHLRQRRRPPRVVGDRGWAGGGSADSPGMPGRRCRPRPPRAGEVWRPRPRRAGATWRRRPDRRVDAAGQVRDVAGRRVVVRACGRGSAVAGGRVERGGQRARAGSGIWLLLLDRPREGARGFFGPSEPPAVLQLRCWRWVPQQLSGCPKGPTMASWTMLECFGWIVDDWMLK